MELTFFSALPNFIKPLTEHMAKDNRVKVFVNGSQEDLISALQTCEVGWFDFANELVIAAQQMYKIKSFRCIVRLHSYEAFTDMPKRIDWDRVDDLVLVNDSVKGILQMHGNWDPIAKSSVRVHVIPNMIDTSKFDFVRPQEKKTKIGYLGHINYKKDPSLVLPISEDLSGYRIHIAGEFQDTRYKLAFDQYMKNTRYNNIIIDGHQKDVNKWFKDKRYILNTSLFESHNLAMSEGMLCGAYPLLRNWVGADNIYPDIEKWDLVSDVEAMVEEFDKKNHHEQEEILLKHRKSIILNYDTGVIIPRIEELINENTGV